MFDAFQQELARQLLVEAKRLSKDANTRHVFRTIKKIVKKSGRGLPAPLATEFENTFVSVCDVRLIGRDGWAEWRNHGVLDFRLVEPLAEEVFAEGEWSKHFGKTVAMRQLVNTLGRSELLRAIGEAVHAAVPDKISDCRGTVMGKGSYQWCIVEEAHITTLIQRQQAKETIEAPVFWYVSGSRDKVVAGKKRAKKIFGGFFKGYKKALEGLNEGPWLTRED